MPFNEAQVRQLLQPINPRRVLKDGKNNSHVSQQDVTAHLTRIFGFGGWSKEVLAVELVSEQINPKNQPPKAPGWDVTYRALVRLTVRDPEGNFVASYDDGSMGTALNQSRGDAHDLAYKSAISLSTKRAAKDLGDNFGLSLYNKGQMSALVGATLVGGPEPETPADVQANVEQQVAMGNDEIDQPAEVVHEPVEPVPAPAVASKPARQSPADKARDELRALCGEKLWDMKAVAERFAAAVVEDGAPRPDLRTASASAVRAFMVSLESGVITV